MANTYILKNILDLYDQDEYIYNLAPIYSSFDNLGLFVFGIQCHLGRCLFTSYM